jgi:hypothetical protein
MDYSEEFFKTGLNCYYFPISREIVFARNVTMAAAFYVDNHDRQSNCKYTFERAEDDEYPIVGYLSDFQCSYNERFGVIAKKNAIYIERITAEENVFEGHMRLFQGPHVMSPLLFEEYLHLLNFDMAWSKSNYEPTDILKEVLLPMLVDMPLLTTSQRKELAQGIVRRRDKDNVVKGIQFLYAMCRDIYMSSMMPVICKKGDGSCGDDPCVHCGALQL